MASNFVLMALVAMACIYVSSGENVKERIHNAWQKLQPECKRQAVNSSCIQVLSTMSTTDQRIRGCDHPMDHLESCLSDKPNCTVKEVRLFRYHICNFEIYDYVNQQTARFSRACSRVYQGCRSKVGIKDAFKSEDYCRAFGKELNGYKCFHDDRMCSREEDQDLYKDIQEYVCASTITYTGSLLTVLLCCVMTLFKW